MAEGDGLKHEQRAGEREPDGGPRCACVATRRGRQAAARGPHGPRAYAPTSRAQHHCDRPRQAGPQPPDRDPPSARPAAGTGQRRPARTRTDPARRRGGAPTAGPIRWHTHSSQWDARHRAGDRLAAAGQAAQRLLHAIAGRRRRTASDATVVALHCVFDVLDAVLTEVRGRAVHIRLDN